ncbi:MAG: hypothetical protein IJI58_03285 [Bacilli bacterium]|nr:hypothetical protein [Bacilli bacterium]
MAYKRRLKFDKRLRFKKKMDIMYLLVFVLLSSIGTGYAYIRSNLNINGTANVTAANWDVHFENLNVTTGSVTATTPADITDDTTVEFAATLEEPNDFYEFTVDVVNEGTMDAMIDSFSISPTLTTAQKKYLEYTIAYSDGVPLASKQELKANGSETIRVRFNYIENSDKTNYPTEDQTFTINFNVNYTQADVTSQEKPYYVFRTNTNSVNPGDNVSALGTTYTSYDDLRSNTNRYVFLRHTISNNQVIETMLGFELNNRIYYLIGGGGAAAFEPNKLVLHTAFGINNCSGGTTYVCLTSISTLEVQIYSVSGGASASCSGFLCSVNGSNGNSHCQITAFDD